MFRPDPSVYDGRFANNAWLQELPKSLTKLTWDNAALDRAGTAARLNLVSGDVVELTQGGRSLRIPVWLAPGQAPDTLTLHLGYGRTRAGRTGTGIGFNVNALRTSAAPDTLTRRGAGEDRRQLRAGVTQDHWSLEGRNLIRVATAAQFEADPQFAKKQEHQPERLTLYSTASFKYEGYAWGMAIDQNVCTGCNACVVACQAENNVPVVGKSAGAERPRDALAARRPLLHRRSSTPPTPITSRCRASSARSAPCEVVCPVAATVHSDEGLNDMVYNRCVGTRYCSNNCPYKVRRFNFLLYQDCDTPSLKLQRNPDVTVRSRGVMEKCTYCVQRINHARVGGQARGSRRFATARCVTACQSACPTDAIVFGNINDPDSRVSKLKAQPAQLRAARRAEHPAAHHLLAVVRNPNTELEPRHRGRRRG